jgi:hypothetical protein
MSNANIEAELEKEGYTYSWELNYEGTSQFPFGDSPKMPLWLAIIEANDARNSMIEEEGLDPDCLWLPDVYINRYIGGEYDKEGRFINYEYDGEIDFFNLVEEGGMGFNDWHDVNEWAETLINHDEWNLNQEYVKKYIAYCNKLREAKVGIYANA